MRYQHNTSRTHGLDGPTECQMGDRRTRRISEGYVYNEKTNGWFKNCFQLWVRGA
ncbi:Protein of unknown function [Pyronema omphalodes CBS 100304]|uniref:Uncharacterized protein n=1 Tax=Pyronema omphalodes (strain CBS 100304) TaxID=1076935 RepID=U4LJ02_PYROM|nr:Protein of unknown function [Pyronema omphalodes CBS 100304]